MKRNNTVVAYVPGFDCHWTLVAPLSDLTLTDGHEQMLEATRTVLEQSAELVCPLEIEYVILEYQKDVPLADLFDIDHANRIRGIYRSDECITAREFSDHLHDVASEGLTSILFSIEISHAKTRIHLESGNQNIDTESGDGYIRWSRGSSEPSDAPPSNDPIELEVRLDRPEDPGDNPVRIIKVKATTDIWFEDTQFELVNKQRLAKVIHRIEQTTKAEQAWFYSSAYDEDDLIRRGYSGLVFE